ncbi:MAG: Cardiolipin synthase [Herminiimonas sp.]|nr:Cardiolipin synthase [Herminiimonas sp.]
MCRIPKIGNLFPTPGSVRRRLHRWALGLLVFAAVAGCASLPDVRYLSRRLDAPELPTVVNGGRELGAQRAQSLLAQRLRHSHVNLARLAALEEAATGSPLIAGNKVRLLFDGPQTIGAMMEAIRGARNNINLETYIFDQDELGTKFADLLIEKQRQGVRVNIIYDGVGTIGTPAAFFERLRAAGVSLTEFNPVNPLKRSGDAWRLNNRDHRKILVVDGRIGFTGGVNIAKDYAKSSLFRSGRRVNAELGWRDTHLRIEGPAVASLQTLFLRTWASQRQEDLPDLDYFPVLPNAGNQVVRVIASEPGGNFEIYKAYSVALGQATKSIHLTVAYFAPDVQILDQILRAARRGVEVTMIFPGISDASLAFYAGRSFYEELLAAGVRIFELQASVLHAKTGVIDSAWSTVGSANIDIRSFLHNSEISVVVLDEEFGRAMEAAFKEDLKNSTEVTRAQWDQRPAGERLKEWASRNFDYFL